MNNLVLRLILLLNLTIFSASCTGIDEDKKHFDYSYNQCDKKINIKISTLKKPVKIMFIADAHFASEKGLEGEYKDFAARMYKHSARSTNDLKNAITKAENENFDAIILAGDIINYPSDANLEEIEKLIKGAKIPVFYTSGNHDWHFEGDSGTDLQQREKWVEKKLKPLYQDANWKLYSRKIGGIKIIMLDNSAYEILPEQFDILERELDENIPTVICAHIPFYVDGTNVFFGCGNPNWNGENDPYYKIERRQKWSEKGLNKVSFDFHKKVFDSPNLIGIFAGHTHKLTTHFHNGKFQSVAPSFRGKAEFLDIEFSPTK